jgi:hypothetical protein
MLSSHPLFRNREYQSTNSSGKSGDAYNNIEGRDSVPNGRLDSRPFVSAPPGHYVKREVSIVPSAVLDRQKPLLRK